MSYEPLKWTRRKDEKDYVAVDGDVTYTISGSPGWWLGTLNEKGWSDALKDPNSNWHVPDYPTLADAKLAFEVYRRHGAAPLCAHRTDARSKLIGGGWGGWARSYGSKWTCTCGKESQQNAGDIREARAAAAAHVRGELEKLLAEATS